MVFQKSCQTLCLFAVVSSVTANGFTWVGRSTSFADASNWDGQTPTDNVGPGGVSMGTKNGPTLVSEVPVQEYQVGKSIQFEGPTTLLLGDGVGTTTLFFDTASNRPLSSFIPSSDFLCNTNWNVTINGLATGASTPPCSNDVINIQSDASYFIQVPANTKISGVKFGSDQVQTTCPTVSDSLTGSKSSVGFAGVCTFTQWGNPVDCPSSSCSTTSTVSTITATSITTITATTTIAATPTSGGGGGGQTANSEALASGGSATVVIVIVVVILLVLVAVFVGVFMVLRKKKADDADRAVQSFENPMYDDVSANTTNTANDSATGYMDVPMSNNSLYAAVDEDGGNFGDENNTGATGYMDVAPTQGDDEDDDEDV